MKRICLNNDWKLQGTEHGNPLPEGGDWIPAIVPGDVHVDLMNAGRLEPMYWADAIERSRWVTQKAWWYRREFTVEADDLLSVTELVFKGIDTISTVFLNGEPIGKTENMFREYRFDVSGKLRTGSPNTLVVCIEPVSIVMKRYDASPYFACFNEHRIFLRKAQCHFGWDWAPNCPGTGIWDSVRLETHERVTLDGLNIHAPCDGAASFFIALDGAVQETGTDGLCLRLCVRDPDGTRVEDATWPATGIKNFRNVFIESPRIWWPNGMGEQPLYTYEIELLQGGDVCDRKTGRFGIRDVRLEEKPLEVDKMGFAFVVNGEPCFCKGANWVPLDSFTGAIPESKYRHMLTLAREAGFNMLRVWGGGIYEKGIFYDLCDELGIMVWQDFMFACGDVPDDHPEFVENVRMEIEYQIKRLRTHTSVVYWVGGNEKSGDFYRKLVNHGDAIFDEMIPGIAQTLDPFRPYRRGSPYAYVDSGNHPKSGDSHLSALWETFAAGSPGFSAYRDGVNRIDTSFNSEFSIQGPARRQSFERFMPSEHYWPIDDLWNYRITKNPYDHHDTRTFAEKQLALCRNFFGEPRNHAEFIQFGMTVHAEAMRDELFGYRTKRPRNNGALFWMYSDPWPTGSWSVVDWYGVPKAAYYAARRAARPLQIGWRNHPGGTGWQLVACNDTRQAYAGEVRFGEESVTGKRKWSRDLAVSVPANASVVLAEVAIAEFSGVAECFLFAELACGGQTRSDLFFPNFWKNVLWPEPGLELIGCKTLENGTVEVSLHTGMFARCVHLAGLNEGCADGEPVYVSDAFFDLRAGETRTLYLTSAAPIALDRLRPVHWLMEWEA